MDPQALDLATKTLAAAIDSLMAAGSTFVPLVAVQRGGVIEFRRVVAGKKEDAAAMAKQQASAEIGADATAFAVDGFIDYNGSRSAGIVVEAWNFSTSRGARIGLRYELKGMMRKKASLIGSPLYLAKRGWYDPDDDGDSPEVPSVAPVIVTPAEPESEPDFGPPPTSAPVPFPPPPSAVPPVAPSPEVSTEVPAEPPAVAPEYTPVPIQRNETPLGNRAMFAGIMELATRGRSFPAFAIVQKDGAWEQVTMTDASLEQAAASVRVYASSRTDADFIAFAVDGFVTVEGAPVTAVVVEVWEYATRVSFSVAQRYLRTGESQTPRLSGRPLMRTQAGWVDVPSAMTLGGQVQFGYRDPDSA